MYISLFFRVTIVFVIFFFVYFKGKNVGVFTKDKFSGDFSEKWKKAFDANNFEKVNFVFIKPPHCESCPEKGKDVSKKEIITNEIFNDFNTFFAP